MTSATSGETQTPSGANDGEVSVIEFVANYVEKETHVGKETEEGRPTQRRRTRDTKSTIPAALSMPNGTSSSGAVRPR